MKGIVFDGEELSVVEGLELREPEPGEVTVRIANSGVCHSDVSVINGTIPFPTPVVLGHEGAGVVEEVGSAVTNVVPGDHVVLSTLGQCGACPACDGGRPTMCRSTFGARDTPFTLDGEPHYNFANISSFSERVVVKANQAIPIPEAVPMPAASLIGCGVLTGSGAVFNRAKVAPGESVAVVGVGGIGLNVVQGCRLVGADIIVGVDTNPAKKSLAECFGMTHFVNPTEVRGDLVPYLVALTGGGADYSFECIGNVDVMRQALECAHKGWGESVIIGVAGAGQEVKIRPFQLVTGRVWRGTAFGGAKGRTQVPRIVDWYMDSKIEIDPMITHTMALDDINQAFHLIHTGKSIRSVITF